LVILIGTNHIFSILLWSWKFRENWIFIELIKLILFYICFIKKKIVIWYIEIHPKGCICKIIFKGLMVLLTLNQRILAEVKLDVMHESPIIKILRWCIYLKKGSSTNLILVCTSKTICFSWNHIRNDGWLNF